MLLCNKFISFFIIYILFVFSKSYVLINLKRIENENEINSEYSPEIFVNNIYSNYYGILNVGYPPQKTEVQFSRDYFGLSMKENICLTSNYFNKNKSITLLQTRSHDIDIYSKRIITAYESIEFPVYNTSLKTLSNIEDSSFLFIYRKDTNDTKLEEFLDKYNPGKACLIFGLKLTCSREDFICRTFPEILKKKHLAQSENYHFIYYSDNEKNFNGGYDAAILIGENPHEYNKDKYKEKNYVKTKALEMIKDLGWIIEFTNYYFLKDGTKISLNLTNFNNKIKGWFWFDLNFIIGTQDYLNSIKKNYFNNYSKKCMSEKFQKRYTVIWCDKDFDTKDFPTLYFQNSEYNYIFELTNKDLFEIRGDKKYFLIVFDSLSNYPWKLGKIFLKKYFFNFETDSKQIGFYNNLINDDPDNSDKYNSGFKIWLWFLWSGLIIIVGFGGFFIGNNIRKKNRKKRANELDDEDYEYKQKNIDNKKDELINEGNNYKDNEVLGIN